MGMPPPGCPQQPAPTRPGITPSHNNAKIASNVKRASVRMDGVPPILHGSSRSPGASNCRKKRRDFVARSPSAQRVRFLHNHGAQRTTGVRKTVIHRSGACESAKNIGCGPARGEFPGCARGTIAEASGREKGKFHGLGEMHKLQWTEVSFTRSGIIQRAPGLLPDTSAPQRRPWAPPR
jgi:hypothetical protein